MFCVLFRMAPAASRTSGSAGVFFIWTSVFNLFVVSVFWALMVDVFDTEQGKRLFGFIAAGATLGGIFGSSVTAAFAKQVPADLSLARVRDVAGSRGLLRADVCRVCRRALSARPPRSRRRAPIGGCDADRLGSRAQVALSDQRQYYIFCCSRSHRRFLYFQQAEIVKQSFADRGARTAFFANVDLWVNVLTLGAQLFCDRAE